VLVDELQRLGYVRRVPDPTDGRARLIVIEPRGRRAVEVAMATRDEILAEWQALPGHPQLRVVAPDPRSTPRDHRPLRAVNPSARPAAPFPFARVPARPSRRVNGAPAGFRSALTSSASLTRFINDPDDILAMAEWLPRCPDESDSPPHRPQPRCHRTRAAPLRKGNTMSTVITGASGHLGRLVVDQLLAAGTPPAQVVATGRDVDKLADLDTERGHGAARGLRRPEHPRRRIRRRRSHGAGLDDDGRGAVRQRAHAIDAAARAGVSRIVYTSLVNASTAQMTLAEEHRRTEDYLRENGTAFVILRNGWYLENYTDQLPMITQYHALLGSAHDGRVSAASRRDLAAAAIVVLTQDGHLGATYELGGTPFT